MKFLSSLVCTLVLLANVLVCLGQAADSTRRQDTMAAVTAPQYMGDSAVFASFDQLEAIHKELVLWDIALRRGIDTLQVIADMGPIQHQLYELQQLANLPRHNNNLRYLTGSKIIADQLFNRVNFYEDHITGYFKRLHHLEAAFERLRFDSLSRQQYRQPDMQRLYMQGLALLSTRWEQVKGHHAMLISRLGVLQGRLATLHMSITDLQETLRFELQRFNTHLFRDRHPLLGSTMNDPYYTPAKEELTDTIRFSVNLLQVYIGSLSGLFILNLILAVLLVLWIYYNHAFMMRKSIYAADIKEHAPRVSRHPLAAAFTMLFCFSPFLYKYMPFILSALFILCLLISLTFQLWETLEWKLRWRWIGLIFLFIRFDLMNLFIDISYFERWLLIGLNIGCIYILITSYFIITKRVKTYKGLLLAVIVVTCLQQLLSVILNLAGYFNAARIFSINSVFTVITAMALKLSVDMLIELTYMFFIRLQHHNIIDRQQSFTSIQQATRRLLVIFAVGVWLVTFTRTANMYDVIYDAISMWLTQDRIIGNATFTFGGVLVFLLIFGLAVLVSKAIGVIIDLLAMNRNTLFDLTGLKNAKLLFRLLILATGIVIAFVASGMPMDRFTIILGALSVGIGFGLQHLVNNIVSGIIIAMEKPIRVGDVIEMTPNTGVVTEIGLRSSTLKTKDGSDVIIPNGDLLAGKLINWTLSGRQRRLSVSFYVETSNDLDSLRQKIHALIAENKDILAVPVPQVVFQELSLYGLRVEVLFWVKDLSLSKDTQSQLLEDIVRMFNTNGIKIVHLSEP
ncbi:MAG: mechanosensitive ion channel [Niastella sp.]|nr:mechanosensitive ion channel [Niastella sp.]